MTPHHPGTEQPEARGLSHGACQVMEFLRHRGASFFADIVRGTSKLKAEIETGLWELVAAGLVTADGFDNLRSLIDPKRRAGQGSGRSARPRHSSGRWSLLFTDQAVERFKAVEATCWILLKRYGVVFRDVVARETNLPKWRELQIAFRRLEDPRRALRQRIPRRTVRAVCGGGIAAGHAKNAPDRRDHHTVRCRSAEPCRHPGTGRTGSRHFRQHNYVPGRSCGSERKFRQL